MTGQRLAEVYQRSLDCVHCGLCLSSCPTYVETGRESSSPRGRIYLLRGVAEGRLQLAGKVAEEAYLCLGCRACETACPSGVRFGSILERARAEVEAAGLRRGAVPVVERLLLRHVVPHRGRLRLAVSLLALAQRLGLDRLARPLLPAALRNAQGLLPSLANRRRPLPERIPAEGRQRGRVGLLVGCIAAEFFAEVNAATARVLSHNGFEVLVPGGQGCCGALQAHAGDADLAKRLARHNARAFGELELDCVVVNSAGCGAAMRDADDWLPGEGDVLAGSVRDVCEWLDEVGIRAPEGRIDATVCYDDPCHLVHGQRVQDAPRRVLRSIPGLKLLDHREPSSCCGAAGTYNLTHPEMSRAVLDRKMAALSEVDPDWIASGNPGCLMQLRAGVAARGMRARVAHPVELLEAAYSSAEGPSSPSRRIL